MIFEIDIRYFDDIFMGEFVELILFLVLVMLEFEVFSYFLDRIDEDMVEVDISYFEKFFYYGSKMSFV